MYNVSQSHVYVIADTSLGHIPQPATRFPVPESFALTKIVTGCDPRYRSAWRFNKYLDITTATRLETTTAVISKF